MGKKYIIELEDKPFHKEDGDFLYRAKGFNSLVFDMTGIGKLTPYTEPDLGRVRKEAYKIGYENGYRDGVNRIGDAEDKIRKEAYADGYNAGFGRKIDASYQEGLSDAWEAARKLWEIDISTLHKIFYKETRMDCYMYYTATEAIAKFKEYEDEDKQKEIKIGNEVKAFEKKPFIVTGFGYGDNEEDVYCHGFVTENGISTSAKKNNCVRTGRHFPELAAVLEKMRGEQDG